MVTLLNLPEDAVGTTIEEDFECPQCIDHENGPCRTFEYNPVAAAFECFRCGYITGHTIQVEEE